MPSSRTARRRSGATSCPSSRRQRTGCTRMAPTRTKRRTRVSTRRWSICAAWSRGARMSRRRGRQQSRTCSHSSPRWRRSRHRQTPRTLLPRTRGRQWTSWRPLRAGSLPSSRSRMRCQNRPTRRCWSRSFAPNAPALRLRAQCSKRPSLPPSRLSRPRRPMRLQRRRHRPRVLMRQQRQTAWISTKLEPEGEVISSDFRL
mmetsp:Transcript_9787/g.25304  ORF Transcript_9787/g.25304 Transcript_9787/m.25304 type:complete len:201 (-) Transcript_9787:205-807(-)